MQRIFYILLLFMGFGLVANSQNCTGAGQTPATAFPVCATDTFHQKEVALCGTRNIPVPCRDNAGYQDINPYWYKFTCFTAGTLGFIIQPINLNDDYDWQLFDVTGRNANDVYTDASLFVSCNWSSRPGATGTAGTAGSNIGCAGSTYPNFNVMPTLVKDHDYLLLVSHFTPTQVGYSLSFADGTASITDPKLPALLSAKANCDGQTVIVKLNKKMKCGSLLASGGDFRISPAAAAINGAVGIGCSAGFDTDSIMLSLASPLPAGSYFVLAKMGSDGNTLLDNCNRNILEDNQVALAVLPVVVTPMDSLTTVACAPATLQLVFKKPIQCSTIAANGSDFRITGTSAVTISGATGNCNASGTSSIITVTLSKPIETAGNFSIVLQTGLDGNTIIDECGQQTPAGASLSFTTKDTVSAAFTYNLKMDCLSDTIYFNHDGRNGVNKWEWRFDGSSISTLSNPQRIYKIFGAKTAMLIVTNGMCSDTANTTINLDNAIKADFISTDIICPNDTTTFTDASTGAITSWNWDFGNGNTSIFRQPATQLYPLIESLRRYPIRLIVQNAAGCSDTLTKNLTAVANCYIAVPSAFTPNGDGLNDQLYPLNAYKADNLEFKIFNRFGQLVWQTSDWTRKWDGRINGDLQPTQTFIWTLRYINRDTKTPFFLKGTSILIR